MKKEILAALLAATMSLSMAACVNEDVEENPTDAITEDAEVTAEQMESEITVVNLLKCPEFTAEENSSAMIDQIALTAKEHAEELTDELANEIIASIRGADHGFYDGADEMEKFMWYGYLLDYKYDDSDARSELGTDLCQAIKYVYRGAESVLDDSTHENLLQVDEALAAIQ